MELRTDRATRSTIVMKSEDGAGRKARKIAEGRCVKTTIAESVSQKMQKSMNRLFLVFRICKT